MARRARAEYEITALDRTRETLERIDRRMKGLGDTARIVGRATGGLIGFETLRRASLMADRFNVLEQRIRTATAATGDFDPVFRELVSISTQLGTEFESTVGLFQAMARVSDDLGVTNTEMLTLTRTVQQLGVIGGSSTEEMSNGIRQFTQGLAGGVFRAEEFNSILENLPELANRIARAMGKTPGQLRQMVVQGELLSKDVMQVLLDQAEQVNQEFAAMPPTLGRSAEALTTSLGVALSQLDQAVGFTRNLATSLQFVADSARDFADAVRVSELSKLGLEIDKLNASIDAAVGTPKMEELGQQTLILAKDIEAATVVVQDSDIDVAIQRIQESMDQLTQTAQRGDVSAAFQDAIEQMLDQFSTRLFILEQRAKELQGRADAQASDTGGADTQTDTSLTKSEQAKLDRAEEAFQAFVDRQHEIRLQDEGRTEELERLRVERQKAHLEELRAQLEQHGAFTEEQAAQLEQALQDIDAAAAARKEEELQQRLEAHQAFLDRVREQNDQSLLDDRTREDQRFQELLADLQRRQDTLLEDGLLTEELKQELEATREDARQAHLARIAEIEDQAAKERERIEERRRRARERSEQLLAQSLLGITSQFGKKSKALALAALAAETAINARRLVQNVASNVGEATSASYTAAAKTLKDLPFPQNVAAAAAVLAQGLSFAAQAGAIIGGAGSAGAGTPGNVIPISGSTQGPQRDELGRVVPTTADLFRRDVQQLTAADQSQSVELTLRIAGTDDFGRMVVQGIQAEADRGRFVIEQSDGADARVVTLEA